MIVKTEQNALTMIAPVDPKKLPDLERLLNDKQYNPFLNMAGMHFGRLLLLESTQQLVYGVNHDGPLEEHLVAISNNAALEEAFSCCVGYPTLPQPGVSLPAFVRKHRKKVHAFYKGHRGFSLTEIQQEQKIYVSIQQRLQKMDRNLSADEIHADIRGGILKEFPELAQTETVKLRVVSAKWVRLLYFSPLLLIAVLAFYINLGAGIAWILLLAAIVGRLRFLEKRDPQLADNYIPADKVRGLLTFEDFIAQNQLTHFVALKDGFLRKALLYMGLGLVTLMARLSFNQGRLSGISSIHFARWQIINGGKHLLFFSDFDGTWENYLGDFTDRAATGLTLIWSNTVDFPRTRFLFLDGATDEERFKNWTRKYQVPSHKWWSGYADLTVENIYRNRIIRQGLKDKLARSQAEEWLKLL